MFFFSYNDLIMLEVLTSVNLWETLTGLFAEQLWVDFENIYELLSLSLKRITGCLFHKYMMFLHTHASYSLLRFKEA